MKKLSVLLGIFAIIPGAAMAYVLSSQTNDIQILRSQGFSTSTVQAVDWANYRNQSGDVNHHYVRQFTPKEHRLLGKVYDRLKLYVDPTQDDGKFGDREIEFSNTWMGVETPYSSELTTNIPLENL